ncbi:glycosyltransferase family 2 protein [Henriciella sp. AS95]|uniref:glycosyltransferase family 2 protein n=1 Tax=Henriciella sp. AS95 TaxID=3135782 RepID=UPI00317BB9CE
MNHTPTVSVVMPVYNTADYVEAAIDSVLAQTFEDFELLVIDDDGSDESITLCRAYTDPRVRIISQKNRGLAGARNTGIHHAEGDIIAFLDSDDLWAPEKLENHVRHLQDNPHVGVSYAASTMIDDEGRPLRIVQRPRLHGIKAHHVFLRNPIGNGSAPVIRRAVFDDIAFRATPGDRLSYFDETFRQSEDIECWIRIALTTAWQFEGIRGAYTHYRINEGGLSANVVRQFETWDRVRNRVWSLDAEFASRWSPAAEAFQLRYLARRCIRLNDGAMALSLMKDALARSPSILWREPVKTLTTLGAAMALRSMMDLAGRTFTAALKKG